MQIRMQDSIAKLKHIHEQELNRLIRDNDRLHRIIVRNGGAEFFRSVPTSSLPGMDSTGTIINNNSSSSSSSNNNNYNNNNNKLKSCICVQMRVQMLWVA